MSSGPSNLGGMPVPQICWRCAHANKIQAALAVRRGEVAVLVSRHVHTNRLDYAGGVRMLVQSKPQQVLNHVGGTGGREQHRRLVQGFP